MTILEQLYKQNQLQGMLLDGTSQPACQKCLIIQTFDNKLVGFVGIDYIDKTCTFANIYYFIMPEMQGRGLATYSLKAFVDNLLDTPFKYLQFKIKKNNYASLAVAKKVGAIHYSKLNFTNHEPMSRFMKYYYLPLY
jgi:RimJ/RimL family protein N-acetyltransferase